MSLDVKSSGSFKPAVPYVKASGAWKPATEAWQYVDTEWEKFFLAGGIVDPEFNVGDTRSNFDDEVLGSALQSDGKIIFTGLFGTFNGIATPKIARLNADGSLDTAFSAALVSGFGNDAPIVVYATSVQSDGKIIFVGRISTFDGVDVNNLLRLNADGTFDTAFNTNAGSGPDNTVYGVTLQSDSKIILTGRLDNFNGTPSQGIARLNSDGTLDSAFSTNIGTGADFELKQSAIQSDDKIVVGGNFSDFDGTTSKGIARLNSDGTLDTAFSTNTGNGSGNGVVEAVLSLSDDSIIVAGTFGSWDLDSGKRYVIKLNANGTANETFTDNAGYPRDILYQQSSPCYSLAISTDGDILFGGYFNYVKFDILSPGIGKVSPDGVVDTSFASFLALGLNDGVKTILVQPDGNIVIGGEFTSSNDIGVNHITRLEGNGVVDSSFEANDGITLISNIQRTALQADGKIILCEEKRRFGTLYGEITRLNLDGTLDSAFLANTGSGIGEYFANQNYGSILHNVEVQSDGKILGSGRFPSFDGIDCSGLFRLNSDGSADTVFCEAVGDGFGDGFGRVYQTLTQPDGKIIVAGFFSSYNGQTANKITRLNADGTLDTAFNTNIGSGPSGGSGGNIDVINLQSDGKIIVGGRFTSFNGTATQYMARLNGDGTVDTAFATNLGSGFSSYVYALGIQSDDKIVAGGRFSSTDGNVSGALSRLNSDGSEDTAFNNNAGGGIVGSSVDSLVIQLNGYIAAAGDFILINGTASAGLARFQPDGTPDILFSNNIVTSAYPETYSAAQQSDGQLIFTGEFVTLNGIVRNKIVRLGGDRPEQ
jgi:uncharacterized delta-60 repeat protein